MKTVSALLVRCGVLLACLCVCLPAFAHDDDGPPPPVDAKIARASAALVTLSVSLVVGAGLYVFLLKRGIIKSKSNDRWE